MMQLAHKNPHLQLKLQDLPERVKQAQNDIWPKECPEALKDGRIEFKATDFLVESPIKGYDIYYVGQPPSCDGYSSYALHPVQLKNIMYVTKTTDIFNIYPTMTLFSHNWPDEECLKILRGVRDALKPTSRVLIRA